MDKRSPQLRKLYYSIGEVSERYDVPPHVLRYWEQEFPQLRPKKNSRSGVRLYQEKDLRTIERIKELLYDKRFTIAGARSQMSLLPTDPAAEGELFAVEEPSQPSDLLDDVKRELREILQLLQ